MYQLGLPGQKTGIKVFRCVFFDFGYNVAMEQTQPTAPQPQFDYTKLFLPVAILIAGLAVGGAILYAKTAGTANIGNTAPKQVLTEKNLKKWARDIKLNGEQFDTCYDSNKYADEILKDIDDGALAGVNGTPAFFINGVAHSGAQPFSYFKDAIDAALKGQANKSANTPKIDDDPVLGNANAPVTIIEFSDYQCPFCFSFWKQTLPQIKKDYIDTGKVKFVYRDFPLNIHAMAEPSARAANCAGEQGKYWEYHDKIFGEQG